MFVLSALGLMHARRVTPGTEILAGHPSPASAHDAKLVAAAHASHNGHAVTVPDNSSPPTA